MSPAEPPRARPPEQPARNRPIVCGGMHKGFLRETPVSSGAEFARLQFRHDLFILIRRDQHGYILKILGGGANHCRSADIDVLDELFAA